MLQMSHPHLEQICPLIPQAKGTEARACAAGWLECLIRFCRLSEQQAEGRNALVSYGNHGSMTDKIKSLHLDTNHGNTKYAASQACFSVLKTQGPTWQAEEGTLVRFRHGFLCFIEG